MLIINCILKKTNYVNFLEILKRTLQNFTKLRVEC